MHCLFVLPDIAGDVITALVFNIASLWQSSCAFHQSFWKELLVGHRCAKHKGATHVMEKVGQGDRCVKAVHHQCVAQLMKFGVSEQLVDDIACCSEMWNKVGLLS